MPESEAQSQGIELLPKWADCEAACDDGTATPLQRFIYEYEPSDAQVWRERLAAAIPCADLPRATGETTVEWQPIETAPKGIDILLVWADGHQQIEYLTDKPSFWFENEPTHWRHLPASPVRAARTEGEGDNHE